jgi:alkanesulfonate monooxygenase SsuD/methylene tetrahydromethanopterin reductase-like flavin-dependent oxidoreductase (luciferase family)
MNFGLLYELQSPKPHTADHESRVYREAMEQIVTADGIGFTHAWFVEHHMLEEWSYSSAPEVFLGALSQRTRNLRLGHGIALLPAKFNNPIRVAERAAALDILSNGRVELGTGRSVTVAELEGFGVDPAETRPMWEEAVRMIPRMWRDEPFEHHGKYFDVPLRNVVPKPVQKPHPPLWLAGTSPETFELAGRNGLGMLGFVVGTPEGTRERIQAYRRSIRACREPAGAFVNEKVGILVNVHCRPSDAQAIDEAREPMAWMQRVNAALFQPFRDNKVPGYEHYWDLSHPEGGQTWEQRSREAPPLEKLVESAVYAIGSPATVRNVIGQYREAGADQIVCWFQFGGLAHEKILASLELFAREVIPAFR